MMSFPKIGDRAQVWYRAGMRDYMPLHGKVGTIAIVSKGKPRNHGVEIDGQIIAIPCGNLRKPQ